MLYQKQQLKKRRRPSLDLRYLDDTTVKNQLSNLHRTQLILFKQPQATEGNEAVIRLSSAMKCAKNGELVQAVSQFRYIIDLPDTPGLIREIALQRLSDVLEEVMDLQTFSSGRRAR